MKKAINIALIVLFLSACVHTPAEYEPDISSDLNPLFTIKTTIERQSPAYQPVINVEVTEDYLKVNQLESGYGPYDRSHYEVARTIYWEDIGDVKAFHDKVWWAALFDKSGEITLYVYPLEEKPTKRFIDAVSIMIKRTKAFSD